jgi:Tol biopolymer transport system component
MKFNRLAVLPMLLAVPFLTLACDGDGGQPDGTPQATATAPMEGASPSPGVRAAGQISFESDRVEDGVTEIYTVNTDGTGLSQLSTSGAGRHAWSPDGSRIAFAGSDGQIYVMNADGSGLTALADGDSPTWSPDGTRIAFTSNRDGNLEIYVMDSAGSGQTNLTNNPADDTYGLFLFSTNPWSPDGTQIAFSRHEDENGSFGAYVMNADGSDQSLLAEIPGLGLFAGWSPDGGSILLFSGDEEGAEILVVAADGSSQTTLISLPAENPQGFPVWSTDGQSIAFTADQDGKDILYLMKADGSNVTPLTTGVDVVTGADAGFERCDGLFGTAWSLDSARIVFGRGCDFERAELWIVNADGSGEARITDAPAFFPAWVPGQ